MARSSLWGFCLFDLGVRPGRPLYVMCSTVHLPLTTKIMSRLEYLWFVVCGLPSSIWCIGYM